MEKQLLINENTLHLLYLLQNQKSGLSTILKKINSPFPTSNLVAQLKNEYLTAKNINVDGLRKPIKLKDSDGSYVLELEYIKGQDLDTLIGVTKLSRLDLLKIISKLCIILAEIHKEGWIHGSVKGSNIIVDPQDLNPTIIDTSLTSKFTLNPTSLIETEKLQRVLQYISPEQTGRTNRVLDHRTDFYSLGIMLYEMVVGELPFKSKDPLDLIYSHLTRKVRAPQKIKPDVSNILSLLIQKLLNKNAEDRYQSAYGIKHDLDLLIENWEHKNELSFTLGERDFTGILQIPQKLYGREDVLGDLTKKINEVIKGRNNTVIIHGESGTGKSVLVQELRKPITKNKGFFLHGKFDQLARNIPYSAWIEIFNDFVKQLLTANEQTILQWKTLLENTLGNSIGALLDLIPNLRFLVPDIQPVDDLSSTENQNRLNDLFGKFFKSISNEDHPIVIFIDDLQWADNASLNLFKNISVDRECSHLLLAGAYRTEELNDEHPLWLKMNEIEHSGVEIKRIHLVNLEIEHLDNLLSDTLGDENDIKTLSSAIFNKTKGNPYFTNQFINTLYSEDLLQFDWDASLQAKKSIWQWDIESINSKFISKNVVELLISKIVELPNSVIETLKSAACIGNNFKLKNLATVKSKSVEYILELLEIAINEGYIFFENQNQIHEVKDGKDVSFRFAHDQVQKAFYSLILDSARLSTHYEIGKLLFGSINEDQISKNIFELVFHLNFGKGDITDPKDKKWLAELNLRAGKEAMKISAFDSAYEYLSIAKTLTEEFIWVDDPSFAIEHGQEYLEAAYLTERFDEAESYFKFLVEKIPDNSDKAALYHRKMVIYQHLSKIDNILDIGLEGLALIGFKFNPNTNRFALVLSLIKSMIMLRGKSAEDMINLPEMEDENSRIAMSLIYKSLTYAYDRSEELMGVLGMKLLQLTLTKGNHDYSNGGYSTYGGVLSVGFNNHTAALKFNRIALSSASKSGNKAAMAMAHFGLGMQGYATLPYSECLQEFRNSVDLAMEVGAHADAAPGTMYFFFLNFLKGMRLSEIRPIILENLALTAQIKTDNFHLILLAGLSLIQELQFGLENETKNSPNEHFKISLVEQKLAETEHNSIRIYARIVQLHNHILYERYDQAKECEKDILTFFNVTRGSVLGPYFQYLRSIFYSTLYKQSSPKEKIKIRQILKKNIKLIGAISDNNPENFLHWKHLLSAEWFKIKKDHYKAQKFFDLAIETARRANYIHEAALANYLCSKYHEEEGNIKLSEYYLIQAINGFRSWGAGHLANFLQNKVSGITNFSPSASSKISIDENSFIKLSELISSEIDFNRLISKLMNVFTENAAAEKAILIIKSAGQWNIEAIQLKNAKVEILRTPYDGIETDAIFSDNICQYVIRTKETVSIDEAVSDQRFAKSAYVTKNAPRSILCIPLLKQGELTGLVYLENNQMAGAFKSERIQMLNYLSSQIAVSVDNAKLYSDLRVLNHAYERFVPREFLKILGKSSIMDVHLGDQVQMEMTVLFADIRGFTGISERMLPSETFEFINDFLKRMGPIITNYNGFVDKYIGDEIMALFPDKADDAIQCGIAMLHELEVFGEYLKLKNIDPIKIGIGVNTGKLMLGTVGVKNRMNSTVISDEVNIASRVEKYTKETGAPFMITKATYEHLNSPEKYSIRKLGHKVFRGKSTPTIIYEVFESDEEAVLKLKKNNLNLFERAIEHYEKGEYTEALSIFKVVKVQNPDDLPSAFYIDLIGQIESINYQKT